MLIGTRPRRTFSAANSSTWRAVSLSRHETGRRSRLSRMEPSKVDRGHTDLRELVASKVGIVAVHTERIIADHGIGEHRHDPCNKSTKGIARCHGGRSPMRMRAWENSHRDRPTPGRSECKARLRIGRAAIAGAASDHSGQ